MSAQLSPLELLGQDVQKQQPNQQTTSSQGDLSPLELLGQDVAKQQNPDEEQVEVPSIATGFEAPFTAPKSAVEQSERNAAIGTGAVLAGGLGAGIVDPTVGAVLAHLGKVKAILDGASKLGIATGGITLTIKEARELYKEFAGKSK